MPHGYLVCLYSPLLAIKEKQLSYESLEDLLVIVATYLATYFNHNRFIMEVSLY